MYSIQHYAIKLVSHLRLLVSSTNKTDLHDITEILLKVALNTEILLKVALNTEILLKVALSTELLLKVALNTEILLKVALNTTTITLHDENNLM